MDIITSAIGKMGTDISKLYVAVFVLALLPGCRAASVSTAVEPPAASVECTSDTDTFCMEGEKDRGLRLSSQGLEYAGKQEYDKAIDLFKQAIALDNSNPEFHYNLAVSHSYKGMIEEEEASYRNVLAIEPDDPKANPVLAHTYFNLACLYALQGNKDQAFVNLEKLFIVDAKVLYHYLQSDEDLKSLRDDPRFKQLVSKQFGDNFQFRDNRPSEVLTPAPSEVPVK